MTWHPDIPEEYRNQIVTGDARELAKRIPDKSIDLVFTSPPFKDEDVDVPYWEFYNSLFDEMLRVTKKVLIIIHSSTKLVELIRRYPPSRLMIWGKGYSQYSYRYNPILVYQIGDYKANKYIWSDLFGVQSLYGNDKNHKYQDPLILYFAIIKMFRDCEIVLDPCAGSGTTAAACKQMKRNYIAFEIDADTAEVARDRVLNTQLPLFVPEPEQLKLE